MACPELEIQVKNTFLDFREQDAVMGERVKLRGCLSGDLDVQVKGLILLEMVSYSHIQNQYLSGGQLHPVWTNQTGRTSGECHLLTRHFVVSGRHAAPSSGRHAQHGESSGYGGAVPWNG